MGANRLTIAPLACIAIAAALMLAHSGEIRERAELALGAGMPDRETALARGFVLGQDEAIDELTREDFRRSGLSHLLAVSGQNVALLALLALPLLALFGLPLRTRLLWVIALIAAYVPLAGSDPSIQRAAVMGSLSIFATVAGRRSSSFYALAVAAVLTLAIDPGVGRDPGWQLSFAAVLGILLLARPLSTGLHALLGVAHARGEGGGKKRGEARAQFGRALADGAAMTIAATVATAPLIAYWFDSFSTTTLIANLLALPAVAPAMWLGMLAAAGGQVPGFPVALFNDLNAPLLAYIAQVAAWLGRPDWAHLELSLDGRGLAIAYATLAATCLAALHLATTIRRAPRPPAADGPKTEHIGGKSAHRRRGWALFAGFGVVGVAALAWVGGPGGGERVVGAPPAGVLRVSVLDVGQGDAILLQPGRAAPVLIDLGPPGAGLTRLLREAGVEALGGAFVTHDQSDHAGGLEELLVSTPVGTLFHARIRAETRARARSAQVATVRLATGQVVRSGRLRLEVLWPPAESIGATRPDLNRLSLVLLARWPGFRMLLTGDAEAESVPLDPGPLDVLKVAHHGSEDTGLPDLLARTNPHLALISAGADNPHGHPSPTTLQTLTTQGISILNTAEEGTITFEVPTHP